MATEVRLNNVRLSYPHLFQPNKFDPSDTKSPAKFRATFLLAADHPDMAKLKAAITQEAKNLWKEKAGQVIASIKDNPNKYPILQDGNKKGGDGYEGNWSVAASHTMRPRIVDRDGKTPLVEADARPYAGCFVNAVIDVAAMTKMGNGVYGYLKGVQFVKDGDAFGGGAPLAEDAFAPLDDTGDTTSGDELGV